MNLKNNDILAVRNQPPIRLQVGDGATDLAACPPADAFIGYGGNQVREKVKAASPWFVESFSELVRELSLP